MTTDDKKKNIIYRMLRWAWRKLYPLRFLVWLFARKDKLELYRQWYTAIKQTQLNPNRPLMLDRQAETREFFKLSRLELIKYYYKYGTPNSYRFKQKLNRFFEERTGPDKLKIAYEDSAFCYVLRLMLAYERYSMIIGYLDYLQNNLGKPFPQIRVCDYGCGVSDMGLLFARLGAKVTLVDLDDKKLDFTVWRFEKRGLPVEAIRVKDTEGLPDLPEGKYDLILATEIFEHIRNPLKLLQNFTKALKRGGFLFDSMAGAFDRKLEGDHLAESLETGNSPEFKSCYQQNFERIALENKSENYLFRKKS
jgi:2-polyprenyl-3-methyl-5-hydroxy-6-metoxy-1,4-benzoquinol methylase